MEKNLRFLSVKEEVEAYGTEAIHSVELLSELLNIDTKLIDELVSIHGTIQEACFNARYEKGKFTKTQAYKLKLIGELFKRNTSLSKNEVIRITQPGVVANLYMQEMRHLEVEHFDIVLLTTKNTVIKKVNISKGTLNSSLVHPREVFKEVLRHSANSIMLIHNHPSGDPTPSKEDIDITNRLVDAGQIMGVRVLDHIIFGDNRFVSMKERQLM